MNFLVGFHFLISSFFYFLIISHFNFSDLESESGLCFIQEEESGIREIEFQRSILDPKMETIENSKDSKNKKERNPRKLKIEEYKQLIKEEVPYESKKSPIVFKINAVDYFRNDIPSVFDNLFSYGPSQTKSKFPFNDNFFSTGPNQPKFDFISSNSNPNFHLNNNFNSYGSNQPNLNNNLNNSYGPNQSKFDFNTNFLSSVPKFNFKRNPFEFTVDSKMERGEICNFPKGLNLNQISVTLENETAKEPLYPEDLDFNNLENILIHQKRSGKYQIRPEYLFNVWSKIQTFKPKINQVMNFFTEEARNSAVFTGGFCCWTIERVDTFSDIDIFITVSGKLDLSSLFKSGTCDLSHIKNENENILGSYCMVFGRPTMRQRAIFTFNVRNGYEILKVQVIVNKVPLEEEKLFSAKETITHLNNTMDLDVIKSYLKFEDFQKVTNMETLKSTCFFSVECPCFIRRLNKLWERDDSIENVLKTGKSTNYPFFVNINRPTSLTAIRLTKYHGRIVNEEKLSVLNYSCSLNSSFNENNHILFEKEYPKY